MDLAELTTRVQATIDDNPNAEPDSPADAIALSIPEPASHHGDHVRVFGRRGPMARVMCGVRGKLTVHVSARRLRDWLRTHGMWEITQ